MRNLEQASVARSRAIELVGHETESAYTCYTIADARDLGEAVEQHAGVSTEASE